MADESTKVEGSELPKDVLAPAEGPRENLVVTAVKFLQNPKVKNSPLAQKKAFLESKGLTKDEIQLAVQRAGVTDDDPSLQTPSLPPQQQPYHPAAYNGAVVPAHQLMPPPLPLSPWTRAKEIATTTAIVAAVSYAVYSLFKKYVQPWLIGKSEMEARQERLEESIAKLHASVAASNAKMADTLRAIQESLGVQKDRTFQNAETSSRVESMALHEIKGEIASLKGLLLNRRQFPPPPTTTPVVPAWQKSAVTDDQTQAVTMKPDADTSESPAPAINASGDTSQALVSNDDRDKDGVQPMDASSVPPNQTSEDNLQASQSASKVTQSVNRTTNGHDVEKSDSDVISEAE